MLQCILRKKKNNNKIVDDPFIVDCVTCYSEILLFDLKVSIPCGHRMICNECLKILIEKNIYNTKNGLYMLFICPICKEEITKTLNIYENINYKKNDNN
tara:strand:+ start:218 stop:514 length:297 start_codon:yes stop_codon:yes gene_type:complete